MEDLGVTVVGETAFLWDFDGTPKEHEAILAGLAAAAEMSDDEVED